MKHIIRYIICMLVIILTHACEQKFERDDQPLILFNTTEYPQLKGHLVENQTLTNQTLLLSYTKGGNREVTINIPEQFGIYAENQQVTLAEETGIIEIPLKGTAPESGLTTLKVRISYGLYHIFCEATIGVRPEVMEDIHLKSSPQINGFLYQNLPANSCFITIEYQNGWGRDMSARFVCDDAGISTETQTFTLVADNQTNTLTIPLKGIPQTNKTVDIHLYLLPEGINNEQEYIFAHIPILQPIPFEAETVTHTISITDRNKLMENGGISEMGTFTYNTIFVDMNGDGYVSGNYEIWLDRNVGATSTDVSSESSYGFIYQPGRIAPGWVANSQTGTTYPNEIYKLDNATWFNGTPTAVVVSKINGGSITVEPNKVGPNNPCPEGYRLPTDEEWKKLQEYLVKNNSSFKDGLLHLPFAGGYQKNTGTSHTGIGTDGNYWAAPYDNNQVAGIFFSANANTTTIAKRLKGMGLSVRCVKANENELATYPQ